MLCAVILFLATTTAPVLARPGVRYRAAVVELGSIKATGVPVTLDGARKVKLQNAAMIEEWTAKAAAKGAQIVVFGEDFADSGWALPFGAQNMYAEPLPQPGTESLCSDRRQSTMPLASAVACAAQKHNITIATGLADLGPCVDNLSPFTQKPFPCDKATGLTAFNSIGVFGPDGNLLAKYHKSHLARSWSAEYEPQWAEASPPDVVTFDSSFGVRFGMFICNDINLGGPTRALLQMGVRDIIFPTLWINFGALFTAVGMQDGFSRAHGVNLLAANGNEMGRGSSGSGIWPADISSTGAQYYTAEPYVAPGQGWMGVADLVSPEPADTPVPAAVEQPEGGVPVNGTVTHFRAVAGNSTSLTASADGLVCNASIRVASGSGRYALIASAGLGSGGWYIAVCAVMPCSETSSDCGLNSVKPMNPLPTGGSVFSDLKITASSQYANTFLHSAICDDGLTVTPRSALTLRSDEAGARELHLSSASCSLMSASIEGRAQSEDEHEACPFNKYPCSTDSGEATRQDEAHSMGGIFGWRGRQQVEALEV
eukprot:TRINITY_DN91954_c0_g1_i1.p1 TRINITY_DN91954_c0_g1~~TRINITY_DN91954_c0_g1_i1.p1  ORF type:complete len:542 (-),score=79.41 TRINITY_DN91954_c0_g1_i1:266-1891(-)